MRRKIERQEVGSDFYSPGYIEKLDSLRLARRRALIHVNGGGEGFKYRLKPLPAAEAESHRDCLSEATGCIPMDPPPCNILSNPNGPPTHRRAPL